MFSPNEGVSQTWVQNHFELEPKITEQITRNLRILAQLPVARPWDSAYKRRAMCLLRLHQHLTVPEIAWLCERWDIYLPLGYSRSSTIQGLIGEAFRYTCMVDNKCVFKKFFQRKR